MQGALYFILGTMDDSRLSTYSMAVCPTPYEHATYVQYVLLNRDCSTLSGLHLPPALVKRVFEQKIFIQH